MAEEPLPPKHLNLIDPRDGSQTLLAIPPNSPWHELLPQYQDCEIRRAKPEAVR